MHDVTEAKVLMPVGPNFAIRAARVGDYPNMLALIKVVWSDEPKIWKIAEYELAGANATDSEGHPLSNWFLALENNGTIIGLACWAFSRLAHDMADFTWAAVAPEHRHQGISTALLKHRIEDFKIWLDGKTGYIQVRTWPVKLYLDLGFKTGPITTKKGKNIMALLING